MNIIKAAYRIRREKLSQTYKTAYDFLRHVENLNENGFYVQTFKNLHLFLEQNFLFYFKMLTANTILLTSTPNGSIRKYNDQSELFFTLLLRNLKEKEIEKLVDIEKKNSSNRINISISKSQNTGIVFEVIKQTIQEISQKRDFIELEKQMSEITDEFQILNPSKNEIFLEGLKKSITTTYYERNLKARTKCIEYWGYNCSVCGFNFEKMYGEIGKAYIHVHHLNPVSEIKCEYNIDPIESLRPVCANCHSMLHGKEKLLTINELKEMIQRR